jgi:hypothetical protein
MVRATVEEEGRQLRVQARDAGRQSGAVLAQRENR